MWNGGAAVVRSDDCSVAHRSVRSKFWLSLRLGKCAEGVRYHRCSVYCKGPGRFADAADLTSRIIERWWRTVLQIVENTCAAAGGWNTSRSATTAPKA